MKFILALYYYEEYDKVIEKAMFLWGVYGVGMLKINISLEKSFNWWKTDMKN